jgi:hypothetical protein
MKPITVGWAKLPGTEIICAQSCAILPTRFARRDRPRGQRAGTPCQVIRRCGDGALPTLRKSHDMIRLLETCTNHIAPVASTIPAFGTQSS